MEDNNSSSEEQSQSEENIENQEISEESETKKWNIEYEDEKKYWENYINKSYIYLPNKCPKCSHTNYSIGDLKNLINPKRYICNNYKCRYRCNLRKFSFLKEFPKIPASIIFKIHAKFIIEENNGIKIKTILKINDNIDLNIKKIYNILNWMKTAFAHFIKDIYKLEKIGNVQGGSVISMDESMFAHENNNKIWVVGAKNNETCEIRLDIFKI